jgi:5-methylcytosine-specific restriction enzyme B
VDATGRGWRVIVTGRVSPVQSIPALRLSYGNLLLKALERRGPATLEELLDVPDVEALFKGQREHPNPAGRAQDVLRFAQLVGLAVRDGRRYALTESGLRYTAAVSEDDPWSVTATHADVLRAFIARGDDEMARDALLALAVQRQLVERGRSRSAEQLGRALARASRTEQWRETRTFESQGARYRSLLEEAGLLTATGEPTASGVQVLEASTLPTPLIDDERRPDVWWVNQGATYGKERDGGFLWAPMLNKAGRAQGHWDSMDRVQRGDAILHYSNGFLRAVSVVDEPARPASNPLETQEWEQNGRIVKSRYRDLNDVIPLAAIPESLRIEHGAPFTVNGSVQQGYLYSLDEKLVTELTDRFPELREVLASDGSPIEPAPVAAAVTPGDVHASFAKAVEVSGLVFDADSNLVRSFISSLLAKPFAILTGLSGSGKTQLAMRLGEWFGHDDAGHPRHLIVPVRPDWTGPEALFGYEDALRSAEAGTTVWSVPDPFVFVLRAAADSTHPYLLILDEMNLAHVERYFADFLSGIESRKDLLPDLAYDDVRGEWIPQGAAKVPLPRNLFVVGTVNVDETTYMFSPKVLDRASTFEFRVNAAMLDPDLGRPTSVPAAPVTVQRGFCDLAEDDEWHRQNPHPGQTSIAEELRRLHEILATADLEFGHRTFYESLRFAAYYAETGDADVDHVLDLIVMQKLLPKVHGSRRRVEPVLNAVLAVAGGDGDLRLPATHRKVSRMIDAVRANQFVSFTE